ncbi:hypothetical protein LZ32DRAFT_216311 [Colletotrichum eremochloae]|nr:hypothetical protein LZ32DRAFT_216311 [Colletotrichum eremochloae]
MPSPQSGDLSCPKHTRQHLKVLSCRILASPPLLSPEPLHDPLSLSLEPASSVGFALLFHIPEAGLSVGSDLFPSLTAQQRQPPSFFSKPSERRLSLPAYLYPKASPAPRLLHHHFHFLLLTVSPGSPTPHFHLVAAKTSQLSFFHLPPILTLHSLCSSKKTGSHRL